MTFQQLKEWVEREGEPSYRAQQIFSGLHREKAECILEITTLPLSLRKRWEPLVAGSSLQVEKILKGLDGAVKLLFTLQDGEQIETVYLPHQKRHSLCISTQVGCPMNCSFCVSAEGGFSRNLKGEEMVEQVYTAERELGISITHVLFMGIGEPLLNLDEVLTTLHILNHPLGKSLSMRRMVISTCGITPQIYALADKELQVVLAISLHATNDELRSKIMPSNRKYPLNNLLIACKRYAAKTRRRITFEYILIKDINADRSDAIRLSGLLKEIHSHINLIPCNKGRGFSPPNREVIDSFYQELVERGHSVTLRDTRGQDIMAACGQLRVTRNVAFIPRL